MRKQMRNESGRDPVSKLSSIPSTIDGQLLNYEDALTSTAWCRIPITMVGSTCFTHINNTTWNQDYLGMTQYSLLVPLAGDGADEVSYCPR